jgi:PD-(D/E)XK nuclease superfamily protein
VQCKWAVREGGAVVVGCYSCRRTGVGIVRRPYIGDEVDALAAYCDDVDQCYLLPAKLVAGRAYIYLRLSPARNNQKVGVRWASAFEFESLDWSEVFQGP